MTDDAIDTEEFDDDDIEIETNDETPTALAEHYRFEADKGQELVRIDKFLDNRIAGVSRNKIQEAAKAGCICANGNVVKQNYRVHPYDVINELDIDSILLIVDLNNNILNKFAGIGIISKFVHIDNLPFFYYLWLKDAG